MNIVELPKDVEGQHLGAKTKGLERQPLIRIVDEKTKDELKSEKKKEKSDKKRKKVH